MIKAAILGATGYAGAELMRILSSHVRMIYLQRQMQLMSSSFPCLQVLLHPL